MFEAIKISQELNADRKVKQKRFRAECFKSVQSWEEKTISYTRDGQEKNHAS